MVSMSVSRALSKLKTIDERLVRIERDSRFQAFAVVKEGEAPAGYNSPEQYQREQEALLQSHKDLVNWKRLVKRAVLKSNATVEVQVNGENLTISEVIELKGSMIYEQRLLALLRTQQNAAEKKLEKDRATQEAQLAVKLKELSGSLSPETVAAITPTRLVILKAGNLDATIARLERFVNTMTSEIDAVLSETNARTMIEVPTEPTI